MVQPNREDSPVRVCISLLLLLVSLADVSAQDAAASRSAPAQVLAKDVIWGVKGGLAMPGVAWIDDAIEYDIETGFAFGAFVDYRLAPKLFGTLSINQSNMSGELSDADPITDVSLLFKAYVGNPTGQVAFRPTLGLGWGTDGDASYLVIHAYLEAIPMRVSRTWVIDGGIFVAPMGGNDEHDIVVEPRFVLRIGALF